jgi:uncharacterized protein (DUF983 family)
MMTQTHRPPTTPRHPEELSAGRAAKLYGRALRLRCPHCGEGRIKGSWMKMRRVCPACGLRTERGEEDFFLGAMMFNMVLAEFLVVLSAVAFVVARYPDVPWDLVTWGALALAVIAPFLFYPFGHAIWLASDILIRPVTDEEMEWHRTHPHDAHRKHRDR